MTQQVHENVLHRFSLVGGLPEDGQRQKVALQGKQHSTFHCSQVQTSRRVAITDHVLTRTPLACICAELCMQLSIHQEYQRYSWEDEAASGGCTGHRGNLPQSVFPRCVKALTQGKWLKPVEGLEPLSAFIFSSTGTSQSHFYLWQSSRKNVQILSWWPRQFFLGFFFLLKHCHPSKHPSTVDG